MVGGKMLINLAQGFAEEFVKTADLIPQETYKKLDDYDKRRMVEIRDTLHEALKNDKIKKPVKEGIIKGSLEELKNMSWALARAKDGSGERPVAMKEDTPKPPKKL